MGKDRSGVFHPGKGKPSGINKEEGLGIQPTDAEHMKEYDEITEKYVEGEDELSASVHLRHPNRNTSKGEDTYKAKENKPESDKTTTDAISEESTPVVPEELPGVLTKDLFKNLALYQAPCCITVYLGTHNAGVEVNEGFDAISFKNALQKAEAMLNEKNFQTTEIETLLEPGYKLLRDDAFWLQQSPGLAIFIADGYFKYIKMPFAADEYIAVEDTFYVTPLIPAIISKECFYVLVISKKQCKLFKADAFNMQPVPVEGLPKGLAEELGDTDVETTFRTGGRGGNGGANFHGIGGGNNNDDKAYIANYLEAVDDVIWKQVLHNETAPLLLAGVEYLIPLYKSVSDYNHIWDDALTGNHEYDQLPDLYKQSREIMQPYFQQRINKALETYGNKSATPLTSSIKVDIIPAAYYGKIAQLFVAKGEHIWGMFDEMENKITYLNETDKNAQDLIDNTVVKTLVNGGEVFLLERNKMPAGSSLAAIFRY
jgi:release factor family 7